MRRRGRDIGKMQVVVDRLVVGEDLDPSNRLHRLTGNWVGRWECHVEPIWLLVWVQDDEVIFLERTGSHSDIFG